MSLLFGSTVMFATETVFDDFESNDVSSWSSWQETATVESADNPSKDDVNGSDKVVKLTTDGEWGSLTRWYGEGGFLMSGAEKFSIKVYASVATTIKLHADNSVSEADNLEMYVDVEAGTWTLVEFDLSAIPAIDYQQLVIQPSADGEFYFDDIILHYSATPVVEGASANVIATDGLITVAGATGADVDIYNMAGVKLESASNVSNEYSVYVGSGVFIVVVNGEAIKVATN